MTEKSVAPRSRGRKGQKVVGEIPAHAAPAVATAPWAPKIVDLSERGKKKLTDKRADFNEWGTPKHLVDKVATLAGGIIGLDPATAHDNPTRAARFFTKSDDGLRQPWGGNGLVFLNPPYGKEIVDGKITNDFAEWTAKVRQEAAAGTRIVTLYSNARKETKAWQELVFCRGLTAMCFVRGRVEFVLPPAQVEARRRAGKTPKAGNPNSNEFFFYNIPFEEIVGTFIDVGLTVKIADWLQFNGGEIQEVAW